MSINTGNSIYANNYESTLSPHEYFPPEPENFGAKNTELKKCGTVVKSWYRNILRRFFRRDEVSVGDFSRSIYAYYMRNTESLLIHGPPTKHAFP